ncbi:unnamed protein product [Adineta steineri]|uniref:Uncharacterized protein n=1 Tax=Adineta steineri TaxID=433720 RepID=A0A819G8C5_9BILA|nr:unnamed protein product [Adineta steineri]CAF3881860.1 unnamed protein product [Adineta steineri]
MAEQLRYNLEQPRDFSNDLFFITGVNTTSKNHYLYDNNHEQLNANSTFRPMTIDLNAAWNEGYLYETAQQQPIVIPNINQPHVNEDPYFTAFNKDSTNAMIINERRRRLENKRQRQHRSSNYRRSRRVTPTTSSDDVYCCCCCTDIGSSTSNSDEDGFCECGDCCTADSCDCSGCDCDCGSCNCGGCDCGSCDGDACEGCVSILVCCLLCFTACDN